MDAYRKTNVIIGWILFIGASIVYFATLEPTASWWDAGEYIATAYKLQVGHPPGAPFFQLMGRFFSLFAFGDTSKVAYMVNAMSGISSGLTIAFLFWTITALGRKMVLTHGEMTSGKMMAIMGSGIVGAAAFTFSDSFWFSAVEGEVYALSSLFTAVTFWAILKWEQVAEQPHADKWLLLIVYLIGLSIGVHLLNLLAIPAIALVYYFKKYTPTIKGGIITFAVSLVLIGFILYGVIPEIVNLFAHTELFFVNSLGLPFTTGTVFFALLIAALLALGIRYTHKIRPDKKLVMTLIILMSVLGLLILIASSSSSNLFFRFLLIAALGSGIYMIRERRALMNTIILSVTLLIIGYSSFLLIIIRSNADTPINENEPDDAVSLLSYLNREQYGSTPIFHGPYYNAPIVDYEDKQPVYEKDKEKGKYVITDDRKGTVPVYDSDFTTIFPRMWSNQKQKHIRAYKQWADVEGVPVKHENSRGKTEVINKPTFGENLKFFFKYQVGHMYFRYFMWNFVGRQNNIQGHGNIEHGNWKSGIGAIDDARLGEQKNLPQSKKNPADNTFYFLPLIFGLIGLLYHVQKKPTDALVVGVLFIMTGLAIVAYLNQYPYQPRERDYAYAGSFYAFAIWIGLSILFFFNGLKKVLKNQRVSAIAATVAGVLLVPAIMAVEGWDAHDRSGKYAARDFATNYLTSCDENAILFTNGDNDTFPLWYAQEVEGVRTDVRVVNYMLASGDWYIHQKFEKMYESPPLPFTLDKPDYTKGTNDVVLVQPRDQIKGYVELDRLIQFIQNTDAQLEMRDGNKINYIPTKKVKITIDKQKVIESGLVPERMHDQIVSEIKWTIKKNYIYKNDLMFLDMLATNDWKRPMYFANPSSISNLFGKDEYMHLEGMVYKLMPVKAKEYVNGMGGVNLKKSYDLLVNEFKWGGLNQPDVLVDRESQRNVMLPKNNYVRTAEGLMHQNKADSAVKVADRCLEVFPHEKITFDFYMTPLISVYFEAGEDEKAKDLLRTIYERYSEDIDYYSSLDSEFFNYYQQDMSRAYSVLQQLSNTARKYGAKELQKEISEEMDNKMKYLKQNMQQQQQMQQRLPGGS